MAIQAASFLLFGVMRQCFDDPRSLADDGSCASKVPDNELTADL